MTTGGVVCGGVVVICELDDVVDTGAVVVVNAPEVCVPPLVRVLCEDDVDGGPRAVGGAMLRLSTTLVITAMRINATMSTCATTRGRILFFSSSFKRQNQLRATVFLMSKRPRAEALMELGELEIQREAFMRQKTAEAHALISELAASDDELRLLWPYAEVPLTLVLDVRSLVNPNRATIDAQEACIDAIAKQTVEVGLKLTRINELACKCLEAIRAVRDVNNAGNAKHVELDAKRRAIVAELE
jgi:hypothetical protein